MLSSLLKAITVLLLTGMMFFSNASIVTLRADEIEDPEPAVNLDNFAFDLFRLGVENSGGDNVLVSPLSVHLALAMTANGAAGETREAMARALGFRPENMPRVNHLLADLTADLERGGGDFRLANSVWIKAGLPVWPSFADVVKNEYQSDIRVLTNAATVNKWVYDKTEGKIGDILKRISRDDVMVLVNALYFEAEWRDKFDEKLNSGGIFEFSDEKRKRVIFMNRCGRYDYLETDRFRAIEIPYAESQMAMYIFLPDPEINLGNFVEQVNPENWHDWLSRMTPQSGMLSLPRFTVECESRLNDILKSLGMGVAFEPGRADFSGITGKQGIWIDRVQHKTYMDVSPEGTVAAAATAVVMTKGMPMNQNNCDGFNMKVDRPFICAIYDKKNDTFLFLGAIADPG